LINRVSVACLLLAAMIVIPTTLLCQASGAGPRGQSPSGTVDAPQGEGHLNLPVPTANTKQSHGIPKILREFGQDQKYVWTSPTRARFADVAWLVPLGGITAGLFVTDHEYSASLSQSSSTISHYKSISNAGIGSLVAAGAGMYLLSFPAHNEHWRETGWLAGEAALNSLVVTEAFKYSLGRQRPYQGDGSGPFFHGGTSFPSEHAAAAWSIAGVIAHEYPGVIPKLLAYGAATAVDFSRVHARQHFPSDVLVGSVLGYLIAQSVYSRRQDPEVGGGEWAPPGEFIGERSRSSAYMGSPYLPLDSWIYPAIERLSALGYVRTASLAIRPWTRLECARLVGEVSERAGDTDGPAEVQRLYESLSEELAPEFGLMSGDQNLHAQVDSVYVRSTGISGKPLTDNQHFGQTILNDFGRPYEEGFNSTAGLSGWGSMGPFEIYVRGEYQSAPSAPALSPPVLNFISIADRLPPNPPSTPISSVSRFRVLDAYVGLTLANWQFSFGKRNLWWGPDDAGSMLFSSNAGSLNKMFSIDRVTPFRLPWWFGYLGDIRISFFIGQASGHEFVSNFTNAGSTQQETIGEYGRNLSPQPFLTGGKISFKFTPNFEVSLGKTTLYGGPGNPLTPTTFIKSTLGLHVNGDVLGDGRSSMDFSYRIPGLRDWVTFYGDAFSEDEVSPLLFMRKSAFQGGLYFPKLPKLSKLDLRVDGGTTSPVDWAPCNGCFYWNLQYVNGYTNNGVPIGTWLGRAAQGEQLRSTYWISPRKKIGMEFRHRKIDRLFLPQGGTQNDVGVNADFFLKPGFQFSTIVQYERWLIPLLATHPESNFSVSFQFAFWPRVKPRDEN
jgi:membrane-associated phospholipid phosphatase